MTHQQLLDEYVKARLMVIGETSGNFETDWRELVAQAEEYAAANGLNTDCLNETREDLARIDVW